MIFLDKGTFQYSGFYITVWNIQPLLQIDNHIGRKNDEFIKHLIIKKSLLLNRHPFFTKISIARLQQLTSLRYSIYVLLFPKQNPKSYPMCCTEKYLQTRCGFTLSKTISFLLSHMAQQIALTHVSIKFLSFHLISLVAKSQIYEWHF